MRGASERDLMARLGTDPAAFEEFYRRHVDAVTLFAATDHQDVVALHVPQTDRSDQVADACRSVRSRSRVRRSLRARRSRYSSTPTSTP